MLDHWPDAPKNPCTAALAPGLRGEDDGGHTGFRVNHACTESLWASDKLLPEQGSFVPGLPVPGWFCPIKVHLFLTYATGEGSR